LRQAQDCVRAAAEADVRTRPQAIRSRRWQRPWARASPLVAEALGYLGGALAVVAGFVAVRQVWPDIPPLGPRGHAPPGSPGHPGH
jgi:hypothetical protein